MKTRCLQLRLVFRYVEAAEFFSDHPNFGGTSTEASRAMHDRTLGTFYGYCESCDVGSAVGARKIDGDATVYMTQDGDECTGKRHEEIKTEKRKKMKGRKETKAVGIM